MVRALRFSGISECSVTRGDNGSFFLRIQGADGDVITVDLVS